ncbi:MAG: DUF4097 domain-containing protein [Defluviitaleaceae bacterium]|nr:DUF4097 domain-containing protein [Defluviitaleaceae bacterium]
MEDNRQFNNDGTPVGGTSTEPTMYEPTSPYEPEFRKRHRFAWNKIALFLLISGGIIFGLGWATGARGGGIVFENGRLNVATNANHETVQMSISGSEAITQINITATSANIIVEPGPSLSVSLSNISRDAVQYSGNTLTINAPGTATTQGQFGMNTTVQFFSFGLSPGRAEIRIQVPPEQVESLTLSGTSGNVTVRNINTTTLYASSRSGNIRLNNIHAQTLSAASTSGNVRGENMHFSIGNLQSTSGNVVVEDISWDALTARSTSGNVRISDAYIHLGRMEDGETLIQSTSGNANLDASNRRRDLAFSLTSRTGTVRVDGQRYGSSVNNSSAGGVMNVDPAGNITTCTHLIRMSTTSGNVRLNFD